MNKYFKMGLCFAAAGALVDMGVTFLQFKLKKTIDRKKTEEEQTERIDSIEDNVDELTKAVHHMIHVMDDILTDQIDQIRENSPHDDNDVCDCCGIECPDEGCPDNGCCYEKTDDAENKDNPNPKLKKSLKLHTKDTGEQPVKQVDVDKA